MAKWKITREYQKILSEKLMDLGNLTAGALIFGQFISGKEFSFDLMVIGIAVMLSLYVASFIVSQ